MESAVVRISRRTRICREAESVWVKEREMQQKDEEEAELQVERKRDLKSETEGGRDWRYILSCLVLFRGNRFSLYSTTRDPGWGRVGVTYSNYFSHSCSLEARTSRTSFSSSVLLSSDYISKNDNWNGLFSSSDSWGRRVLLLYRTSFLNLSISSLFQQFDHNPESIDFLFLSERDVKTQNFPKLSFVYVNVNHFDKKASTKEKELLLLFPSLIKDKW
jgi:hypothetical protein